jgi:hypothetical protein
VAEQLWVLKWLCDVYVCVRMPSCTVNKRAGGQLQTLQKAQDARIKALSSLRAIVQAEAPMPVALSQAPRPQGTSVTASALRKPQVTPGGLARLQGVNGSQGQVPTQGMAQLAQGPAGPTSTSGRTAPKRPLPASDCVIDLTDSPPVKR